MTTQELQDILEKHRKWMNYEPDGVRASLYEYNLQGINLSGANLSYADLRGADLQEANLLGTNLCGADLSEVNLRGALLRRTDLRRANLRGADLYGADLREADFQWADLSKADLRESNLSGSKLQGTNISDAYLGGSRFSEAKNFPFVPLVCPEKGEFVGFKKCNDYIIKLLIPADAKRSSSITKKCRASYAKVLSITSLSGDTVNTDNVTNTTYAPSIVYKVGEFVYPDSFDENRWNECSHGIHFFMTRKEAVEY